eukprot:g4868.t1
MESSELGVDAPSQSGAGRVKTRHGFVGNEGGDDNINSAHADQGGYRRKSRHRKGKMRVGSAKERRSRSNIVTFNGLHFRPSTAGSTPVQAVRRDETASTTSGRRTRTGRRRGGNFSRTLPARPDIRPMQFATNTVEQILLLRQQEFERQRARAMLEGLEIAGEEQSSQFLSQSVDAGFAVGDERGDEGNDDDVVAIENMAEPSPLHDIYRTSAASLHAARTHSGAFPDVAFESQKHSDSTAPARAVPDGQGKSKAFSELDSLRALCDKMAQRISILEQREAEYAAKEERRLAERRAHGGQEEGSNNEHSLEADADAAAAVAFTLKSITGTLSQLGGVFTDKDEKQTVHLHSNSVTRISAWARMVIARRKYASLKTALRRLRRRRFREVRREQKRVIARRAAIDEKMAILSAAIDHRFMNDHFVALRAFVKKMLPIRTMQEIRAKEMNLHRTMAQLREIMKVWCKCATGPGSKKNVALRYQQRLAAARQRIERRRQERGSATGLITAKMLGEDMAKEATRLIHCNRDRTLKKMVWK